MAHVTNDLFIFFKGESDGRMPVAHVTNDLFSFFLESDGRMPFVQQSGSRHTGLNPRVSIFRRDPNPNLRSVTTISFRAKGPAYDIYP